MLALLATKAGHCAALCALAWTDTILSSQSYSNAAVTKLTAGTR